MVKTMQWVLDAAVAIIAQQILARAADTAQHEWENYPEIGEADWDAVLAKVTDLAPFPEPDMYKDAYALLEARAESV